LTSEGGIPLLDIPLAEELLTGLDLYVSDTWIARNCSTNNIFASQSRLLYQSGQLNGYVAVKDPGDNFSAFWQGLQCRVYQHEDKLN